MPDGFELTPAKGGMAQRERADIYATVLSAMEFALFERIDDGGLEPVSEQPEWFLRLTQRDDANQANKELVEQFPAIEAFYPLAEEFWRTQSTGQLLSDFWTEADGAGVEYHLTARAIHAGGRHFLAVERVDHTYTNQQQLQLYAHEMVIHYETIAKLNRQVQRSLEEMEEQKRKTEEMLRNILPDEIAKELQMYGSVQPMYFEDVTVCFTDFVGFSRWAMTMAAEDVVHELHRYFTVFDKIVGRYGIEKLKTIGDSYMFVSGLPRRRPGNPIDAVLAALEIVEAVKSMACDQVGVPWEIRVGIHTGPVIAGVVGIHKFAFDIWGETVNLASRMESCGMANRVNVSEKTFARIKDFLAVEPRGRVKTKEGQEVEMYFVEGVLGRLVKDCSEFPPPAFYQRYQLYFRDSPPSFPTFLTPSRDGSTPFSNGVV